MPATVFLLYLATRAVPGVCGADASALPPLEELLGLLRTNLTGISPTDLDRAATQGLLQQLRPNVSLVGDEAPATPSAKGPFLTNSCVYEGAYGYVRVARVEPGLADSLTAVLNRWQATNKLKGLVLDLRFADGQDYAAAAQTADRFLSSEQPLLNWGAASAHSAAKTNAIELQTALLVNRQTAGAAEALAAVLRHAGVGLIIGSVTSGEAWIFTDFPLSTGQRIRIATAPVRYGDGEPLPGAGLKPDLEIAVDPSLERTYLADPFKPGGSTAVAGRNERSRQGLAGGTGTNSPLRRPLNEAELVRRHRNGQSLDEDQPDLPAGPAPDVGPVIRDPALARALDLLKGLSVVRRSSAP